MPDGRENRSYNILGYLLINKRKGIWKNNYLCKTQLFFHHLTRGI
jgi:hypothetical protein